MIGEAMAGAAPDTAIRCRDGCKRAVASPDDALAQAWRFLDIAKGWRCPECAHALDRVNAIRAEPERPV